MKKKYIENKIKDIIDKIEASTKKSSIIKAITIVIESFTGVLGAITFLGGLTGGLGYIATAILCHLIRNTSTKTTEAVVKYLNKEKEHLEKIKTENLDSSDNLNAKRKRKIIQLQKEKQKLKEKGSRKTKYIIAGSGAAILGSVIFPVAAPFITTVWALGTRFITKKKVEENKKQAHISARIANLVNDLNVIILESKNREKNTTKVQQPAAESNALSKTKTTSVNKNGESKKKINVREQQDDYINDYIKRLEMKPDKDKPKQKVNRFPAYK